MRGPGGLPDLPLRQPGRDVSEPEPAPHRGQPRGWGRGRSSEGKAVVQIDPLADRGVRVFAAGREEVTRNLGGHPKESASSGGRAGEGDQEESSGKTKGGSEALDDHDGDCLSPAMTRRGATILRSGTGSFP